MKRRQRERENDLLSGKEVLPVVGREAWRDWLSKNHAGKQEVWILFHKKHTGRPSIPYDDAVEEALCFGWIDSLVRRIDEERYIQKFTPRKKKSAWSASNKERVQRMIELGRMTPAGMANIEEAKRDGSWSRLDSVERLSAMPVALGRALSSAPGAMENFRELTDTQKKQFLWWIESAQRADTKERRIAAIVKLAAKKKTLSDHF